MNKTIRLGEIAKILESEIINGEADLIVNGIKGIENVGKNEITFADNIRHLREAFKTDCIAVIVPNIDIKLELTKPIIKVKNPKYAFAKALEVFDLQPKPELKIAKSAYISKTAVLGNNLYIGENVVIGDNAIIGNDCKIYPNVVIGERVKLGNNVKIYPNATLYYDTVVGNNVIIHANVVLGSDGFGYAQTPAGHYKVPQTGNVVVGDNVEIGALTAVDRATTQSTKIGNGVKIDNHVHLAHNVKIGNNTLLISDVAIAGSTEIGQNCVIAGKTAIRDHIKVGDNTVIVGMSGVTKSVKGNCIISGFPAKPHSEEKKLKASYLRLPEALKTIHGLQEAVVRLQRRLEKIESEKRGI